MSANTKKGRALEHDSGLTGTLADLTERGKAPDVVLMQELLPEHTDTLKEALGHAGFEVIKFADGYITDGGLAIAVKANGEHAYVPDSAWSEPIVKENSRLHKASAGKPPFWYRGKQPIVMRDAAGIALENADGSVVSVATAHPHPPFGVPGYIMWKNEMSQLGEVLDRHKLDAHIVAGDFNVFGKWMRGTLAKRALNPVALTPVDIGDNTFTSKTTGWRGKPDVMAHSKDFTALNVTAEELGGSDHKAPLGEFVRTTPK